MSDSFNTNRLSLLLKNHLVEHRQKYTYYTIGMFVMGLIVFMFYLSNSHFGAKYDVRRPDGEITIIDTAWDEVQTAFYVGGLLIFGAIFSSASFVNFGNKGEAIFYFIKPASQFEKWLTEIIVRIFLCMAVYTIAFYILAIPTTWYINAKEYANYLMDQADWEAEKKARYIFHPSGLFHFGGFNEISKSLYWTIAAVLLSIYISVIAFFMYGSVLFNRYAFFKTLLLGFITFLVYLVMYLCLFNMNRAHEIVDGWYFVTLAKATKGNFQAKVDESYMVLTGFFLLFFVPAILLICSYLKLKEKEV